MKNHDPAVCTSWVVLQTLIELSTELPKGLGGV